MAAEFSTEVMRMATAGGVVAAVAVPVGVAACAIARHRHEKLLPPCKAWRVPWTGFELFGTVFLVMFIVPALVAMSGVEKQFVGLAAFPAQLGLLVLIVRVLYPRWNPFRDPQPPVPDDWAGLPARSHGTSHAALVAVAVLAWMILTPPVLLFHVGILELFSFMNWQTVEHPLTQFRESGTMGRVFFALQACVTGPFIEEILFRGGILPWVIGASAARPGAPPQVLPRSLRPWLVIGIAVVFAAETQRPGPAIFAGSLAAGLAILWLLVRRGGRNVRGVFATSALFAAVHSSVWPSPVPLFPLAIGLGYVAVRTHGVFVPFLVHGLFNAVSVVYVLRGGAG